MNHYAARQRADIGRWDYTCLNDDRIWPIGYCAPRTLCVNNRLGLGCSCGGCDKGWVPNPDYCGGHASAADAEACFARYMRDQGTEPERYADWTGCEATGADGLCDAPTKRGLRAKHPLGGSLALCDLHRNDATFLASMPTHAGTTTASW